MLRWSKQAFFEVSLPPIICIYVSYSSINSIWLENKDDKRATFWQLFEKMATFEKLFMKFRATFREISSNLWTGLMSRPVKKWIPCGTIIAETFMNPCSGPRN